MIFDLAGIPLSARARHESLTYLEKHTLDKQTLGAADRDDPESAGAPDFVLYAVEVVFDRLFGAGEVAGDFFVGAAFGDERNDLLNASA